MFYQRFQFWGRATPDAIAVISGAHVVTYAQALRRVDWVAARLNAAGVRPGHHVIVPKARHVLGLVTQFALDKIGASSCYLADQPPWIDWRVVHEPTDEPRALLVSPGIEAAMAKEPLPRDLPAHAWDDRAPSRVQSSSGSTGRPKSILRCYASIRDGMANHQVLFGLAPGARCAAMLDWSGPGLNLKTNAWMHGATLVVPDPKQGLLAQAAVHKVSILCASPMFLQTLAAHTPRMRALPGLRLLLYGGRAPAALLQRLAQEVTPDVYVVYGSTETGSNIASWMGGPNPPDRTVGYVIPGCGVEVIDEATRLPCGPGQIGHVRTAVHVPGADGYVDDAGQLHPYQPSDPAWFATGDLGFFAEDGALHIAGREDDVVNLGGLKLVTSDLEDVVIRSGHTLQQAVFNVASGSGPPHVCAAVVPRPGVDLAAVRQALKAAYPRLANVRILGFEQLPMLANGKVDYPSLRKAAAQRQERTPAALD